MRAWQAGGGRAERGRVRETEKDKYELEEQRRGCRVDIEKDR